MFLFPVTAAWHRVESKGLMWGVVGVRKAIYLDDSLVLQVPSESV